MSYYPPNWKNFRRHPNRFGAASYLIAAYKGCKPYLDHDFAKKIKNDFFPRFWELLVIDTFLRQGFQLQKTRPSKAHLDVDLKVALGEKIINIEASCPVHLPNDHSRPDCFWVDEDENIRRLSSTFYSKSEAICKRMKNGAIGTDEPNIIALNGGQVRDTIGSVDPPDILRLLFNIGQPSLTIEVPSGNIVEEGYANELHIKKINGGEVFKAHFESSEFEHISAVLYSTILPWEVGEGYIQTRMLLILNPLAKNPIGNDIISMFRTLHKDKKSHEIRMVNPIEPSKEK